MVNSWTNPLSLLCSNLSWGPRTSSALDFIASSLKLFYHKCLIVLLCGALLVAEGKCVVILLIDMTMFEIYEDHVDLFKDLKDAVDGIVKEMIPTASMPLSVFTRYWTRRHLMLKIAKIGSNFFNLCKSLKSTLFQLDKEDARYEVPSCSLNGHRDNAMKKHE